MQNGGRKEASTLQRYQRKLARLKRRLHVLQLDLRKAGSEEEVAARIKEEQGKVKQAIKRIKRRIAAEIKAEKKRKARAAKRSGGQTKSQSFLEFSEIVKSTPVRFCDRVGIPPRCCDPSIHVSVLQATDVVESSKRHFIQHCNAVQ